MIVFFGTTLSNLHDAVNGDFETGPVGLVVLVGGSIIALLASLFLSIVVKRHFDSMLNSAGESAKEMNNGANSSSHSNENPQCGGPDEESPENTNRYESEQKLQN